MSSKTVFFLKGSESIDSRHRAPGDERFPHFEKKVETMRESIIVSGMAFQNLKKRLPPEREISHRVPLLAEKLGRDGRMVTLLFFAWKNPQEPSSFARMFLITEAGARPEGSRTGFQNP